MRTHVEFQSDKFPSLGTEEEGVNWDSGILGKLLSDHLSRALRTRGYEIKDVFAEDSGWLIELRHDGGYPLYVACGSYDPAQNSFLCFTVPFEPVIKRWFRNIDVSAAITALAETLGQILLEDSDIRDVRWWTAEEVEKRRF